LVIPEGAFGRPVFLPDARFSWCFRHYLTGRRFANCAATEAPRMRAGTGLLLLGIVTVLVRASGYTGLADAIAMGYLALVTTMVPVQPADL
jgi:hypothetical protein